MARKPAASHFCGRCPQSFSTRQALKEHLYNHPDSEPAIVTCAVCKWPFETLLDLEKHSKTTGHCQETKPLQEYLCNRCSITFSTQRDYNRHRELGRPCCDAFHASDWKKSPRPDYVDADKPKEAAREIHELAYGSQSTDSPSDMSEGRVLCKHCKKTFGSDFARNCHLLGCKSFNSKLATDTYQEYFSASEQANSHDVAPISPNIRQHTLTGGKTSSRLPNSIIRHSASQPKVQTVSLNTVAPVPSQLLLQPNISQGRSRGGRKKRRVSSGRGAEPVPLATYTPLPTLPVRLAPATHGLQSQVLSHQVRAARLPAPPKSHSIGGTLDIEQAKSVCGKVLRLLLQTDVFIHHDGKVSVSGINWTRIGVERQPAVVGMFESMCHLPRKLQLVEYLPAPTTFMAEYIAQYPVSEFESAPIRNPGQLGLSIIAIACSTVVLSNACQEVVKIAAVDVLTCRVLMSHLVCTDRNVQVANWHTSVTGLKSFTGMENARQAGYRVLKGWTAARSAVFKFVDKDTIIVGHNLRSQLDALRIIHGRAVDIAKVIEKAAQGPLSKAQVSLDSWCRDIANVARLKTDPVFGRDCVLSAFAAREIGLWSIKNREKFEKVARQKTHEYQSIGKV